VRQCCCAPARRVAAALPDWDCDIVEFHHKRKTDAPSGTAMDLGMAVAEGRGHALAERAVFSRHGQPGPRGEQEIGFAALRGGDVVGGAHGDLRDRRRAPGTHASRDEPRYLRPGRIAAAIWLARREPGMYSFDQVLAPSA
jgi:4-hydroxy-tetrahydrodipicolinate reductase